MTQPETIDTEHEAAAVPPDSGAADSGHVHAAETPAVTAEAAPAVDRTPQAINIVKNHAIAATGIGLIPIPLADLAALSGLQMNMVRDLCKLYEVPFKDKLARSVLTSLASGAGVYLAMSGLSSLAKAVPGLGSLAGSAGLSTSSAAITYASGSMLVQHFQTGGTLGNFSPVKVKDAFVSKIREGAAYVRSRGAKAAA